MSFAEAMKRSTLEVRTENGALAYSSTGYSDILDLYAVVGALRTRPQDVLSKFAKALEEDVLLTTRLMFYARDVRGGLGEREVFRLMLKSLAHTNPLVVQKNIALIPYYGRWDDLFVLFDTPCQNTMLTLVKIQMESDMRNMKEQKTISLLAKWMPSINTSSRETVIKAKRLAEAFGLSEKSYRKRLSSLREYLRVVERSMSKQEWQKIAYEQVPSKAMNKYRNAFRKQDTDRFLGFLDKVEDGTAEIKATTLFPYDIVEKFFQRSTEDDRVLEAQWKALPNYIDSPKNILVMADVSGSMMGRPMATSVGLAMYFAERNTGDYHNLFMTFSSNPQIHDISKGATLRQRIRNISNADWGMNTNLKSAFDKVLDIGIREKARTGKSDLPAAIVVISDMEIDYCTGDWGFYEAMEQKYAQHGFVIPQIVFWNVESRKDTFLVDGNRKGVQLVSGQSASIFKQVMNSIGMTPYEGMLKTLNSERYRMITI